MGKRTGTGNRFWIWLHGAIPTSSTSVAPRLRTWLHDFRRHRSNSEPVCINIVYVEQMQKPGTLCTSKDIASCMPSEGWHLSPSVLYPLFKSDYGCGQPCICGRATDSVKAPVNHSQSTVNDTIHGLRSSFIGKLLSFPCSTGRLVLSHAM